MAVDAVEEKRHRAGADVRAGDRLVADAEDLAGETLGPQPGDQGLEALGIVGVGDADAGCAVGEEAVVGVGQGVIGLPLAADLVDADVLA